MQASLPYEDTSLFFSTFYSESRICHAGTRSSSLTCSLLRNNKENHNVKWHKSIEVRKLLKAYLTVHPFQILSLDKKKVLLGRNLFWAEKCCWVESEMWEFLNVDSDTIAADLVLTSLGVKHKDFTKVPVAIMYLLLVSCTRHSARSKSKEKIALVEIASFLYVVFCCCCFCFVFVLFVCFYLGSFELL